MDAERVGKNYEAQALVRHDVKCHWTVELTEKSESLKPSLDRIPTNSMLDDWLRRPDVPQSELLHKQYGACNWN